MKQVTYIFPNVSTFTTRDKEIIQSSYKLVEFEFYADSKLKLIKLLLQQLLFLLKNRKRTNIILCQFAGFHSFLPVLFTKLFNTKTIIITGGTDCVSFPSINYGNYRNPLLKFVTSFSLKNCTTISSIHEALMYSENTFFINPEEAIQGYKKHIPNIKTPDTIIYNGYDGNEWHRDNRIERNDLVFLTGVGKYYDKIQYLKGFDLIIECAQHFPEAKFVIVGVNEDEKPQVFSDNVIFHPVVNKDELFIWYNKASFYFQISISEGFPNALSESMLCECIPIVSGVSSMPEIVNGCGFVVKKRDVNELITSVNHVIKLPEQEKLRLAKQSRDKVLEKYSLANRKTKLLQLIEQLV